MSEISISGMMGQERIRFQPVRWRVREAIADTHAGMRDKYAPCPLKSRL